MAIFNDGTSTRTGDATALTELVGDAAENSENTSGDTNANTARRSGVTITAGMRQAISTEASKTFNIENAVTGEVKVTLDELSSGRIPAQDIPTETKVTFPGTTSETTHDLPAFPGYGGQDDDGESNSETDSSSFFEDEEANTRIEFSLSSIANQEYKKSLERLNNKIKINPIAHEIVNRNVQQNNSQEINNIDTLTNIKNNYIKNVHFSNAKRFFLDSETKNIFQNYYLEDLQNIDTNIKDVNKNFNKILDKKNELMSKASFANKVYNFFDINSFSNSLGKISKYTLNDSDDVRFRKNYTNLELNNISFSFTGDNFAEDYNEVPQHILSKILSVVTTRSFNQSGDSILSDRIYNSDRLVGQCFINLSYSQDLVYKDTWSFEEYDRTISNNGQLNTIVNELNSKKFDKYPVLNSKSILSYDNRSEILNPIKKYQLNQEDLTSNIGQDSESFRILSKVNQSNTQKKLLRLFNIKSISNVKLTFKNSFSSIDEFFIGKGRLRFNESLKDAEYFFANNDYVNSESNNENLFSFDENPRGLGNKTLFNIFNFSSFDLLISTDRLSDTDSILPYGLNNYEFLKLKNAISLDIHPINKSNLERFSSEEGIDLKKAQKILMSPRFTYQSNPVVIAKDEDSGNLLVDNPGLGRFSNTSSVGGSTGDLDFYEINLEAKRTYNLSRFECGRQEVISPGQYANSQGSSPFTGPVSGFYVANSKVSFYSRSFVFDDSSTCFLHIPFAVKKHYSLLKNETLDKKTIITHDIDLDISFENIEAKNFFVDDILSDDGERINIGTSDQARGYSNYSITYFPKVYNIQSYLKNSFNSNKLSLSVSGKIDNPIKNIQSSEGNVTYLSFMDEKERSLSILGSAASDPDLNKVYDFGSENFNLEPSPGYVVLKNTLNHISFEKLKDKFLKFDESLTSENEDFESRIYIQSSQNKDEFLFEKEKLKNIFLKDSNSFYSSWAETCNKIKNNIFKLKSKNIKEDAESGKVHNYFKKFRDANSVFNHDLSFLYGDSSFSLFKKEKSDFLNSVGDVYFAKNNYSEIYNDIKNTYDFQVLTGNLQNESDIGINKNDYIAYLNKCYPKGPFKSSSSYFVSCLKKLKTSLNNLSDTTSSNTSFTKLISDVISKDNENIDLAKVLVFSSLCYLNGIDVLEDKDTGFSFNDYSYVNENLKGSYQNYIKKIFNINNFKNQKSFTIRVADFPYYPKSGVKNMSLGSLPGVTINLSFNKGSNFIVHSPGRIINDYECKGLISIDVRRNLDRFVSHSSFSDDMQLQRSVNDISLEYTSSSSKGEDQFFNYLSNTPSQNIKYKESDLSGSYTDIIEHYSNNTYNYDVYLNKIENSNFFSSTDSSDILYTNSPESFWSNNYGLAGKLTFLYRRDSYSDNMTPDTLDSRINLDSEKLNFNQTGEIVDRTDAERGDTYVEETTGFNYSFYTDLTLGSSFIPSGLDSERLFADEISKSLLNNLMHTDGYLINKVTTHRNDSVLGSGTRQTFDDIPGDINYHRVNYYIPDRLLSGYNYDGIGGQESFVISIFDIINNALGIYGIQRFETVEEIFDFVNGEKDVVLSVFKQTGLFCKMYSFFFDKIIDMSLKYSIDDLKVLYQTHFNTAADREWGSEKRESFKNIITSNPDHPLFKDIIISNICDSIQACISYYENYLTGNIANYDEFSAYLSDSSNDNVFTSSIIELMMITKTLHNSDVVESMTHDIIYAYLKEYEQDKQQEIKEIFKLSSFFEEKLEENLVSTEFSNMLSEKTRMCKLSKHLQNFSYYHNINYEFFKSISLENQEDIFRKIILNDKDFFSGNIGQTKDAAELAKSNIGFVSASDPYSPVNISSTGEMDIIRLGMSYELAKALQDEKIVKIKVSVLSLKYPEAFFPPINFYYSPYFTSLTPSLVNAINLPGNGYSLSNAIGFYNINENSEFKRLYGAVNFNEFREICEKIYDKVNVGRRDNILGEKYTFVSTFFNRIQNSNAIQYLDYFRGQNFTDIDLNKEKSFNPHTKLGQSAEKYMELLDGELFQKTFNDSLDNFYQIVEDNGVFDVKDFTEIVDLEAHSVEYFKLLSKHISESQIYDLFNENKYFDIFNLVIDKKELIDNFEIAAQTGLTKGGLSSSPKITGIGDSFNYVVEAEIL